MIFRSHEDYFRMKEIMRYYALENQPVKYSLYEKLILSGNIRSFQELSNKEYLVEIIAYCIMPTHIHLILCQLKDEGISIYMKNLLNSYTRYFNIKNNRKGPLWQGRFKSILIQTDEQLLHLTRYIHLNPTSDNLVDKPENWKYSSYHEYLQKGDDFLCAFQKYINIDPRSYNAFVGERRDYQQKLAEIRHLCLE